MLVDCLFGDSGGVVCKDLEFCWEKLFLNVFYCFCNDLDLFNFVKCIGLLYKGYNGNEFYFFFNKFFFLKSYYFLIGFG